MDGLGRRFRFPSGSGRAGETFGGQIMLAAQISMPDPALLSEANARIAMLVLPQYLRRVLRQADAMHLVAMLEVLLRQLRLQAVSLLASHDLRTLSAV